jgi:hypothetical protein
MRASTAIGQARNGIFEQISNGLVLADPQAGEVFTLRFHAPRGPALACKNASVRGEPPRLHGLVEGPEKALVAELAARYANGLAFGTYDMLIGLAALATNMTSGVVRDRSGSAVAFAACGALALAAAVTALTGPPRRPR